MRGVLSDTVASGPSVSASFSLTIFPTEVCNYTSAHAFWILDFLNKTKPNDRYVYVIFKFRNLN